jgi:hypothetical protein
MIESKFPTEIIELPSKGVFYSDPILSTGKIRLKLPTALHEDILTSKNLINKGIVIDEFLKSLIVDSINYDDLLIIDINALLIASRILLYGSSYTAKVKCPLCEKTQQEKYDISLFETKNVDFSKFQQGLNVHEYEFPVTKIKIKFKFLTHKDEISIKNQLKIMRKNLDGIDQDITTRLAFTIIDFDGETSPMKIHQKIKNELPSKDSHAFRIHLSEIAPGIDSNVHFVCNECQFEEDIRMPMGTEFFWPTGRL